MKAWRALGATGGFTLLEALIALALMGIILGALATISSQWLPNWNRGIGRLQRQEYVALALERLSLDLAATEFIPLSADSAAPYFEGRERSVTFIRTALSPNAKRGLEIVRIAEEPTSGGPVLVRRGMPFKPVVSVESFPGPFSDPVVLLRPPYRLAFEYAASPHATSRGTAQSDEVLARAAAGAVNGPVWQQEWHQQAVLPRAVMFSLQEASSQSTFVLATATLIHAQLPARCLTAKSLAQCQNPQQQAQRQNAPVDNAGATK